MRTVALLLLLSLAGCGVASAPSNDASFTPYRRVEKSTERAVRLSDADKKMLLKAGAKFVGQLEIADDESVGSEAAKVGATHYLQVSPGRYVLFRVDPEAVSTTMLTSAPVR